MTNHLLSPIDPEILVSEISERITANIFHLVRSRQSQVEEQEKLMTAQEAAKFLNLKVPTVYSKVSKGELPYMKRSKRLYFSSSELLDYLKEGRNKSNAEIEREVEAYLLNNNKAGKNGK